MYLVVTLYARDLEPLCYVLVPKRSRGYDLRTVLRGLSLVWAD